MLPELNRDETLCTSLENDFKTLNFWTSVLAKTCIKDVKKSVRIKSFCGLNLLLGLRFTEPSSTVENIVLFQTPQGLFPKFVYFLTPLLVNSFLFKRRTGESRLSSTWETFTCRRDNLFIFCLSRVRKIDCESLKTHQHSPQTLSLTQPAKCWEKRATKET